MYCGLIGDAEMLERYVRCRQDGTYSPLDDENNILVGLCLHFLPKGAKCVGEFDLK